MGRESSDKLRAKNITQHIAGKEILDIGSSAGFVHKLLREKNKEKKFYTADIAGKPDYKIDLNNPTSLKKRFDTIIAGEILEHVENPRSLIRFCSGHLKKNGRLILTTPNAIGIQYLRNPSWNVEGEEYNQHISAFTMPMLRLLLKKEKFKIVEEKYINAFWMNRNPLQAIPLIFPRLKTDLMIVGEKTES